MSGEKQDIESMRLDLIRSIQFGSPKTITELWQEANSKGLFPAVGEDLDPVMREIKAANTPKWQGRASTENPTDFILTHYKTWLDEKRLRRDHIHHYDPLLVDAYRKWIHPDRHPEDAISMAPSRKGSFEVRLVTESGHVPSSMLSDEQRQVRNRRGKKGKNIDKLNAPAVEL